MKRKVLIIGIVGVFVLMLAPITVAAATNPEIVAIMAEGIGGHVSALKETVKGINGTVELAYCAAGVTALCP